MQISPQRKTGANPKHVIFIAEININGEKAFMASNKRRTRANSKTDTIIKLYCSSLVFDSKRGAKSNIYPIKTPIHAIGNQNKAFVYAAQVNKRMQIETKLVDAKPRSFFSLKNVVNVGTKE